MKKRMFLFLAMVVIMSVMVLSCKKTPAPTAEIFATIDGYTVTFNPEVTNVNTYAWDFDDGSPESTEAMPVHTYASFGEYNVELTVTGQLVDGTRFEGIDTIKVISPVKGKK